MKATFHTNPHSILIIGPAWVGDMVMAQSLFKYLKQQNPHVVIDVLAPLWTFPLLERMSEVREAIEMPVGHGQLQLGSRWQIARRLKKQHYNQSIVLPNSLKSALIPFFAGIKQRTGWLGEARYILLNDSRKLNKQQYPLMIDRFVALADSNGSLPKKIPHPELAFSEQRETLLEKFHLKNIQQKPVLALCPGAEFGPAKQWPAEYYCKVAAEAIAQGWQVWLFGSVKDKLVTESIIQGVPDKRQEHCINLAGETTLAEAIDLLSFSSAVISNDSGLMHIAAALNKPLVAIYGSTSPGFTPPLTKDVKIIKSDLDCAPCFQRECPLGHTNCLKEITPATVLQALQQLPVNF